MIHKLVQSQASKGRRGEERGSKGKERKEGGKKRREERKVRNEKAEKGRGVERKEEETRE